MPVPMSSGAGRYRYVATVEQRSTARLANGETPNAWIDFKAGIRAGFEPVRGREFYAAGRISAETTHVIYMRYLAGLTEDMRINFGGRLFDIETIIDIDERHREYEITAIERKNNQ